MTSLFCAFIYNDYHSGKAKLVQFYHESGSIVSAQRRFRHEFNKTSPHRNLIRAWVRRFSEEGDVKKRKNPGRLKVADQLVNDVHTAIVLTPHVYQKTCSITNYKIY